MEVAITDDRPIFGQVSLIVKNKEKWWLIFELLETIAYDENLFAWELKSSNRFSIFDPCQLNYYHKGLDLYSVNNSTYVCFTVRLTSYEWFLPIADSQFELFLRVFFLTHYLM